ncbi:MAG: HNH endonuclease [Salinibacter sp.]
MELTRFCGHRVAYYIEHAELPDVVRHTCDNPSGVNPTHLKEGTQRDNIRDRQAKD